MYNRLVQFFSPYKKDGIVIAFSGGVDSCLILSAACEAVKDDNKPVLAVTFETRLHPTKEISEARTFAKRVGARHQIIKIDEFSDPRIIMNPVNRCYLCKHLLFSSLREFADTAGYRYLFDGTNIDDTKVYRPGLKALDELHVISPLKTLEITKACVRTMAADIGLKEADKPSAPCLATRLPYGTPFDYSLLDRIRQCEDYLIDLGLYNVRVRYHKPIVRIETDHKDFPILLSHGQAVVSYFKEKGFDYITLDLEGFRSGSMDLHVNRKNIDSSILSSE